MYEVLKHYTRSTTFFSLCLSFPFYISHFHYRSLYFYHNKSVFDFNFCSLFIFFLFIVFFPTKFNCSLESFTLLHIIYYLHILTCILPMVTTRSLQSFHVFPLSIFVMFLDTMVTSLSLAFHNFCIN